MTLEVAIAVLMMGLYSLALLALANWRDLAKDRSAVVGEARYFVQKELSRVRLRFLGWVVLGTTMLLRLILPDDSTRAYGVLAGAILGVSIFAVEAIMGRLERRKMLRGGG